MVDGFTSCFEKVAAWQAGSSGQARRLGLFQHPARLHKSHIPKKARVYGEYTGVEVRFKKP